MNAPDPDPFAYDAQLRALYEQQTPPPPPEGVWRNLQPHLRPPQPARPADRRAPLLASIGGMLLGALLMWLWLPHPASGPAGPRAEAPPAPLRVERPAVTRQAATPGPMTRAAADCARPQPPGARATRLAETVSATPPSSQMAAPSYAVEPLPARVAPPAAPLGPPVAAVLLPLVAFESQQAILAPDTAAAARAERRGALRAARAALDRLAHRADSLLLTLGEPLPAVAVAPDSAPVAARAPRRRWSVALAFAPERNFFGLRAPAGDSLSLLRRTHEQGRAGYNAALLAEYRLTDRLSVGAGLGLSAYGAELRLTDHRTTIATRLDSTTTTTTQTSTRTSVTWNVRPVADSILSPILDFNNQVIGYHYLPTTRLDTVWTHLETTDVSTRTITTFTPVVTTRQELSARVLRPNYRFLTVPVLLRYRLGRATDWDGRPTAPRWWTDVAVGAQLQFFLGGTQAFTRDGLIYQTERVGPRGGPFRPLNVALTGAVAFNYALTPRLSAGVGPTLRYQLASVYRASTHLSQRPTAAGLQLGLKFAF